MMYSEYIKDGGTGIIALLSKNQTLKYLLSDVIQPLDTAFNMENGSKRFTLTVENLLKSENDLTPIANMMKVRFGQYWQVLYNSQPNDTDPVYSSITESTGELNSKGNNINQVSGYDSPDMVNSDGSNSTGNQTNNTTLKTLNYADLTKMLDELKKNVFYDKMLTDIRNYMFDSFYGNERE